jgi:16S rRNA (uracil1498-N3)-methyltransferase
VSAPRFHCPVPLKQGGSLVLPEAVANHAVRVLRLKVGDELVLFDGEGGESPAVLTDVARNSATVSLSEYSQVNRESPLDLWLVQALAVGDKMDWIVQKAVELGATGVLPWQADRSVLKLDAARADKRRVHWEAVAVSACEQCGRNRIPFVEAPQSLTGVLARCAGRRVIAMMPATGDAPPLRAEPMALVVGPEGGFSDAETMLLKTTNATLLNLGPRVLRTETAGLAALAALNAHMGDFGLTIACA